MEPVAILQREVPTSSGERQDEVRPAEKSEAPEELHHLLEELGRRQAAVEVVPQR
jgi:hypothetical protein